ncbi:MAG: deoxyguanosinetriphosphate triphosphohydrolase [Deltaproteobacteria bacterium]|nr:deoxyguanosinetriphosphate triphosphohydrolase [Deltaproteobacteria bacterium]
MTAAENIPLAPWAERHPDVRGRRYPETHNDGRPDFERDRDRIIHTGAFRRLEYKTQVFVNHEGDYYRTRLTHSIEVAQVSRAIARRLRLNEDLAEALALSHDLGHPPFGHSGEAVLNGLMREHGGFEHNLQSLRIVEELETRYPGFPGINLTWVTREGILKHSPGKPFRSCKRIERLDPSRPPSLEAQLIDLADEIAYLNHDIDDGLESGLLDADALAKVELWAMALEEARRRLRDSGETPATRTPKMREKVLRLTAIRWLIGHLIGELAGETSRRVEAARVATADDIRSRGGWLTALPEGTDVLRRQLKAHLYRNLYQHPRVEAHHRESDSVVSEVFLYFAERPDELPDTYRSRIGKKGLHRCVCDYVAGMTDRYAYQTRDRIRGK